LRARPLHATRRHYLKLSSQDMQNVVEKHFGVLPTAEQAELVSTYTR
jgi:hypothetical protein